MKIERQIVRIDADIELVKKNSVIDYDALCSKDEYLNLEKIVTGMHSGVAANSDSLTRLTAELDELSASIREPLSRVGKLETRIEAVETDLHNKVSNHDLYHQLSLKASAEKTQSIEKAVVELTQHVGNLDHVFADRADNEQAHNLL